MLAKVVVIGYEFYDSTHFSFVSRISSLGSSKRERIMND